MTEFVPAERGTTIRYPSTSLFPVNSADRYPNWTVRRQQQQDNVSSPYDFYITKQTNLLTGFFTRISATEVNFPWTIRNVSLRLNTNTLWFDVSGVSPSIVNQTNYEIMLNDNFYTASELASSLETALNGDATIGVGAGITWTVDFDEEIGYFNIDTNDAYFLVKPNANVPNNYKQLFDMMGFFTRTVLKQPGLGGIDGDIMADMMPIKYIDITSDNLTYCQNLKDASTSPIVRDTLCRVYLVPEEGVYPNKISFPDLSANDVRILSNFNGNDMVNWGSRPFIIHRMFPFPKQIKWDNIQPIGQVRFQVYLDNGDIIPGGDFGNDADWQMTLQVSEV